MAQELRKPVADPTVEEDAARSLAARYRLEIGPGATKQVLLRLSSERISKPFASR